MHFYGYDAAGIVAREGAWVRVPVRARRCRTDTCRSVCGARHRRRIAAILIVGTGPEALAVERVIDQGPRRSVVVGFYPAGADDGVVMRDVAGGAASFPRSADLSAIVERFKVDEVIVAVREQRGGVLADARICSSAGCAAFRCAICRRFMNACAAKCRSSR